MEITRDFIDTMAEGAIILDGFEDCIIGITEEYGCGPRLLYSVNSIITDALAAVPPTANPPSIVIVGAFK